MPGKKGYQHDEVSLVILDYNSWVLTEFVLGRTICYSFHDLQDKGILNVVSLMERNWEAHPLLPSMEN